MPPAPAPATTSAQALGNVQSFQSQEQTPQQLEQGADQSLGVPGAQQQVSGLRQAITNTTNLLNNVAPTVMGNTGNSLVTSSQAGQQISNASAPIEKTLSGQTSDLTNDQSNLSNLLSQAGQEASLGETSQNDQLTNLENIYKDLYGQEQDAAAAQQQSIVNQQNQEKINESGASANAPTDAEQLAAAESSMASELKTVAGGDGYVSPASYAQGMQAWVAAGLDPKVYDQDMAIYRNPNNGAYLLSTGKYSGAKAASTLVL